MTITPTEIYWITRLDNIKDLLGVFAGICFVVVILSLIIGGCIYGTSCDSYDEDGKKIGIKILKSCWISSSLFIAFLLIDAFVPSEKSALLIFGIPAVTNSQVVQKLPDEAQQLIDKYLKDKT